MFHEVYFSATLQEVYQTTSGSGGVAYTTGQNPVKKSFFEVFPIQAIVSLIATSAVAGLAYKASLDAKKQDQENVAIKIAILIPVIFSLVRLLIPLVAMVLTPVTYSIFSFFDTQNPVEYRPEWPVPRVLLFLSSLTLVFFGKSIFKIGQKTAAKTKKTSSHVENFSTLLTAFFTVSATYSLGLIITLAQMAIFTMTTDGGDQTLALVGYGFLIIPNVIFSVVAFILMSRNVSKQKYQRTYVINRALRRLFLLSLASGFFPIIHPYFIYETVKKLKQKAIQNKK